MNLVACLIEIHLEVGLYDFLPTDIELLSSTLSNMFLDRMLCISFSFYDIAIDRRIGPLIIIKLSTIYIPPISHVYNGNYAGLVASSCSSSNYLENSVIIAQRKDALLPEISPSEAPQPLLPLLAPSPFSPFTNSTMPKLSGMFVYLFFFDS